MNDHFFLTLSNKRLGLPAHALIFGALLTGQGFNASAADVTVQPTVGSSFVVKDSTGAVDRFRVQEDGLVGIGTAAPINRLQIGDPPGYNGNDLAIGNGLNGMSLFQSDLASYWYTSTNYALMPFNGGQGYLGIGTDTPAFPLDVHGCVNKNLAYAVGFNVGSNRLEYGSIGICAGIRSDADILAFGLFVYSDSRIKDIHGVSATDKDLATINAIQITDYSLKDKTHYGDRPFKKVIAQQVENVYPQVVSKHVDFIPNVYQAATRIEKIDAGYLLHFDNGHPLSTEAKRIKLLGSSDNTMQQAGVVSIPSERDLVIDLAQLSGDKVFVYGEEVNDFRTVDYEGLTALNISATQELSKQLTLQQLKVSKQEADMASKNAELAELRAQLAEQKVRVVQLEGIAGKLEQIEARLAALKLNADAMRAPEMAMQR